jgi:hypothetical protein
LFIFVLYLLCLFKLSVAHFIKIPQSGLDGVPLPNNRGGQIVAEDSGEAAALHPD